MNKKFVFSLFVFLFLLAEKAFAHCPLCTAGAAVAAGGAAWLGVDHVVIGLFIGAFAASTGWWISNIIKKKYVPFQKTLLIIISFASIVLPILPLMSGIRPYYLSIAGEYGSLLNRTYIINLFFIGSLIGGLIVCITPRLSKKITETRGKTVAFQGTLLTLALLILVGVVKFPV